MNRIAKKKFNKLFLTLLCVGMIFCTCGAFSNNSYAQTLPELNQSTAEKRVYNFIANEIVTLTEKMGITGEGEFSIFGLDKSSNAIDFDSFSGFEITNFFTDLNISNLTLKNALSETGSVLYYRAYDSKINLTDLIITNNTSKTTNKNAYGGAIYSEMDLTITNSDLTANSAISETGDAGGGFIYSGAETNITNSNLTANSAESTDGNAYGGAIYSTGKTTLKNTNIIGNYAISTNGKALGGAIYSTGDVSIIADSANVEIVDNYTQDATSTTNNAIYMAKDTSTLNLTATNNGSINLKDSVDGVSGEDGYNVNITGDGTGKINFTNISNSKATASNVNFGFADGKIEEHSIDNLKVEDDVNLILDVDLTDGGSADTLVSTNGTGTINISELSLNDVDSSEVTIQVLKDVDDMELNIDKLSEKVVNTVSAIMYNDNVLADSVTLAQTTTQNDSITIKGAKDLLYEMTKVGGSTNLRFRTTQEYILTADLPESPRETYLYINNISDAERGVINANGHSMFKLTKSLSTIALKDIEVKNASSTENGSVAYIENNTAYLNANNVVFKDNHSDGDGGVIYTVNGTANIKNSNFTNNSADGSGGVMYLNNDKSTITNTTFENNTASDKGGAIYTKGAVKINADNGTTLFKGNTVDNGETVENNAIYVDKSGSVTLNAVNNGVIEMYDKIDGATTKYNLNVTGDETGNVNINNTVTNARVYLKSGNLNLEQDNLLSNNEFNAAGGHLNLANGEIGKTDFSRLNITGNTTLSVDVSLKDKTMDRITANSYGNMTKNITINNINLLDGTNAQITKILFADPGLRNHVKSSVKSVIYSDIYKYGVSYNKSDGYFTFRLGGGGGGGGDIYNPAILTGVASQQIAYLNQLTNYEYATYHSFTYMLLPKNERNKLYSLKPETIYDGESYSPSYINIPEEIKSIWVRPYSSFESVPLKNGPKITSINYGLLAGGDSDMISLKHGFKLVYGGYFGYNGNSYHYGNVNSTQQGGLVGGTVNLYHGNFFNTLTANIGWQMNNSDTAYGSDMLNMLITGFSDKFGYNIETFGGRLIFQPSLRMGYTYVGMFDYTSSNNVKIKTEPLHVMHFIPGLRIIGNTRGGWQPYATVNIICNFNNNSHYVANDVVLPSMSVNPYVEYGIGLQRRWADKYSGFAQVTVRSGGRRGAAILFGFRCMLGKMLERTVALFHPDPERKIALFKEKRDPNIIVEKIQKKSDIVKPSVDETAINKPKKPVLAKKSKNPFRRLKEKISYICHKDVSARMVRNTHSDGVFNVGLDGMKKSSYDNMLDFKDNDRNSSIGTKPTNVAKTFNDYNVSQVNIDIQNNQGYVLKTDAIKKLNSRSRLLFLNQRKYVDKAPITNFNSYKFELINIRF